MAQPDAWSNVALININDGTTDMDIRAITETIDIDLGDKDVEYIANLAGGRLKKNLPEAETVITFEGYPVEVETDTDTTPYGLINHFFGGTDTSFPTLANNSRTRDSFTVTIMFTDTTDTSATVSLPSTASALRYNFAYCNFVSCKPSYTDKILKATWKFKCAPYTKAGTANITVESTDATATMPSI